MGSFMRSVVARDLALALRERGDALAPLGFFALVAALFPLGVGPEPERLAAIAPGVLWIAAVLAQLLALNRVFASDLADGTLEQVLLAPFPPLLAVLAKMLAHWLVFAVPLVAIAPLAGVLYGLRGAALETLAWSLALGTPALAALGSAGAALTLGLRGAPMLLALLVLPLYVPVLVFGAGAVESAASGLATAPYLALLGGLSLFSIVVGSAAASAALPLALQ